MDLAQYDKWVIGNQKRILDWTKMHSKDRYAPIRDAFSAYHRAKSNKQKIQAFENLKKELVSGKGVKFNDLVDNTFKPTKEYLQGAADKFTKGDIDALDRNSNLSEKLKVYDDLAPLSEAMGSIPGNVKGYDWVELDKAFRDNYSYDEMKALADKYNFDYTDPKERKEFIELLSDMEQKRLKEEAYTPHDAAGMLTQIAYPVSLEYARKHDAFHPGAILTDLASQAVMAGGEGLGNMLAGKAGSVAGGMFTAPAITEAGQYIVNDKPAEDALADYAVGVGTNAFAPGSIKGMLRTFDAPFTIGEKGAARQVANKFADEYEKIVRAQRSGVPYRYIPELKKQFKDTFNAKLNNANASYQDALMNGEKNALPPDITKIFNDTKNEVQEDFIVKSRSRLFNDESGTKVYKNTGIRQKPKELSIDELNDTDPKVINITPEDREKAYMFRWRHDKPFKFRDDAKKQMAMKKMEGKDWTAEDLANAGIKETPIHALTRTVGRYAEPLKSLSMNLGASTRLTDRKFGMLDRYLNLPWKYGEKEEREIDFSKPEVKAYIKAYGRYKGNENYFKEPPKLKGYSEEELEKIKKAAEIISINDIFGE